MAQYLNTNISSLNSQRHLNNTQSALQTSLERLSSGKRINTAKDDAAGLGISERMTTQINGMNQAIRNANDGISMSQTAEGALASSGDMLQRIRTLAVQSSNATNNSIDRQSLQDEVNQLTAELNRIATTTKFNGQNLLDGTLGAQYYQVGANAGDLITTSGTNFQTHVYGNHRTYTTLVTVANGAALAENDATISGKFGTAENVDMSGSAKEAAAAVNAVSDKTGVTASAKTEALFTGKQDESYTLELTSNNTEAVNISFTIGSGQTNDAYSSAINAFNAATSKTGVSAAWDETSKGIKLVNSTGETITLKAAVGTDGKLATYSYDSQNGGKIDVGTVDDANLVAIDQNGVSAVGTVTFDSDASFSLTNQDVNDVNSQLKSVASLDISTFEGAQLAIKIVDSAIDTINAERAKYGALQSRFESTVKNLEINSENTSNARSRIRDADYASETAEMSRASILQQAGTAMLAQANQSKQTVLSLLS